MSALPGSSSRVIVPDRFVPGGDVLHRNVEADRVGGSQDQPAAIPASLDQPAQRSPSMVDPVPVFDSRIPAQLR